MSLSISCIISIIYYITNYPLISSYNNYYYFFFIGHPGQSYGSSCKLTVFPLLEMFLVPVAVTDCK